MKIKKLALGLALVLSLGCLSACGGSDKKESNMTADTAKKMADELAASTTVFSDQISSIDDAKITTDTVGIAADNITSSISYQGTGATAEQIVVIETKDGKDISQELKDYASSLANTYESYDAEEVPKLEKAIIEKKGNFNIFVVANNVDAAKEIIDKY